MTFNNVLASLYEAGIYNKRVTFQRVYTYFKVHNLMYCDILRDEFETLIFEISDKSHNNYETIIDKYSDHFGIKDDMSKAILLTQQKSKLGSAQALEEMLLERFFEPAVQGVFYGFSDDLARVYTLYCEDNYRCDEVVLNWDDIVLTDTMISEQMVERLFADTGVVPNYITASKLKKLLAEFVVLRGLLLRGRTSGTATFEDVEQQMENCAFDFDIHDFTLFLSFAAVKVLAQGDLDMYNIEELVALFFTDYLLINRNDGKVVDRSDQTNVFLSRLRKHQKYLLHREVLDPVLEDNFASNGLGDFCVDYEPNDKLEPCEAILKQVEQTFALIKLERAEDENSNKTQTPMSAISGKKTGDPATMTLDSNKAQRPAFSSANKFCPTANQGGEGEFSNLELYKKLRAKDNLNSTKLPEDKVLAELELIYELPEYHKLSPSHADKLNKFFSQFVAKDYLLCVQLATEMLVATSISKPIDYEFVIYLYYYQGLVYLRASKTDRALNSFYNGLKIVAK